MTARRRRGGTRRREARAWWRSRDAAIGLMALLLIGGLGLLLWSGLRDQGSHGTAYASLDKSKGAADAPVVVVEYGDFQ